VLLTCSNQSLCETAALKVAPPCNVPVRGHQVKIICPHVLNKFLSPTNVKLLASSILCACCVGTNSVNLVKNGDNFVLKCTPCGHQLVCGCTVTHHYNVMKECVLTNKCCSN